MARCRNLKPGFFTNEKLAELPPLTRLLFAGLWCIADRDGRLEDRPKRIKAEILPYDDVDVDQSLELLTRGDDPFIIRYQVAQQRYIQVCHFRDHQHPHNTEKPSEIPGFPLDNESLTQTARPGIGIEVRGLEVRGRKGDARGKPRVTADMVPVPEGWNTGDVLEAIRDWLEYKAKRGESYQDASYLGRKVKEFVAGGPQSFIAAVDSSIGSNYAGLFPAKGSNGKQPSRVGPGQRYRETN